MLDLQRVVDAGCAAHRCHPCSARRQRIELRNHPLLEGLAGGQRLGDAHTRHARILRQLQHALRQRFRGLAVVDQYVHAPLAQVVLEGGDIGGARFRVVHHGQLKTPVAHLEADRVRHIAEDRLGRGHGHALVVRVEHRDAVVDRLQRREERREARVVVALVRGIGLHEIAAHGFRDGRHRGRVVPEMRIVAGLPADELRHDDRRALRHPSIRRAACPSTDRSRRRYRRRAPHAATRARSSDWLRTDAGLGRGC